MVETRGAARRKSTSTAAQPSGDGAAAPSPSPHGTTAAFDADAPGGVRPDYAAMYREQLQREREEGSRTLGSRLLRRAKLLYYQLAVTWVWFMLEPWEVALVFACLLGLLALVVSACFADVTSFCAAAVRSLPQLMASMAERPSSSTS